MLFFGIFTRMGEEEFIDAVTARLQTTTRIYRTMARDIYQNGTVLQNKKYRLLGYAYRIFLVGPDRELRRLCRVLLPRSLN